MVGLKFVVANVTLPTLPLDDSLAMEVVAPNPFPIIIVVGGLFLTVSMLVCGVIMIEVGAMTAATVPALFRLAPLAEPPPFAARFFGPVAETFTSAAACDVRTEPVADTTGNDVGTELII